MFKLVLATEDPVLCLAALDSQLFFAVKSTILIYSLVAETKSELRGHKKGISCMQLAQYNNNNVLVTGSKDKTVRVWDTESHTCMHTFYGHKEALSSVHLIDNQLFTGSKDFSVRVYNFENGECTHQFKCETAPLQMSFHTPSNTLFVRSHAAAVYGFRLLDKGLVDKATVFPSSVQSMALGDGTLFCGWEDNTIRLYNVETGTLTKVLVGHQKPVESLIVAADALFSCARGEIRVWNTLTGQCKIQFGGDQCASADLFCLADSKSGTVVIAAAGDRQAFYEQSVKDILRSTKLGNVVEACNKQGMTVVDLSRCDLTSFPEYELDKPQMIVSVRLASNKLAQLPVGMKEFKKLKELVASDNVLTKIQPEVLALRTLKKLHLDENYLSYIPPAIGKLVLLEDLNLAGNELRVIPTQFGELVNLTSLDLSKNKLIALPKRLANLAKLQRLFLNNNLFGDKIDSGVDVPLSPRGGLDPAIDEALGTSPSRRPKKKSRRRNGASGQDDGETSDDGYKSDSKIAPRITSSPDRGSLTARAQSTVVISPRTGLSSDGVYRNVTHEDISSGDQVYLVDFPFGKLDALSTLHLQSNRLSRFPKFISNCGVLNELGLSSNQLKKIPSSIASMKSLTSLSLSKNQLSTLPDALTSMLKLESLWLDDNKLKELPEKFEMLHGLKRLFLDSNSLQLLPMEFGRLVELHELSLEQNGFLAFPSELTALYNLRTLNLDKNSIKELPTEVYFMTALQSLSVRNNQLNAIPSSSLMNIQKLFLDFNQIKEFSGTVTAMRALTDLSLSSNAISEISPDVAFCSNLVRLNLSSNKLKEVPPTLSLLPRLKTLNLEGNNQLQSPAAAVASQQSTEAILESMGEGAFGSLKPTFEGRVVLVGLEGCGKTSLLYRMKNNKFLKRPKPTKGIDVDEWTNKVGVKRDGKKTHVKVHFSTWDFGGSSDYSAMHHLFLPERAVYLVVWDLALDEGRSKIDFWLHTIRNHASQAPVIIVGTHMDAVKNYESVVQGLEKKYAGTNSKYGNVKHVIPVSCVTGQNVELLAKRVGNVVQSQPYMGEKIPATFSKFVSTIIKERAQQKTPLMELPDFQKLAIKCGIDKNTFSAALHYVHDLGVVYNLSSVTFDGFGAVVLDPAWVARLLTSLLASRKQFFPDGSLHHDNLQKIWPESEVPMLMHYPLIAMVHRLELAFDESTRSKQVSRNFYTNMSIFPALLAEQPVKHKWFPRDTNKPEFVKLYKLGFVPQSLMGRLMARVFRKTKSVAFWREGFIVEEVTEVDPSKSEADREPSNIAKVEIIHKTASLKVVVRGNKPVTFMKTICEVMDDMVRRWYSFPRMQVSSYVSYPNEANPEDVYIFPLQHIENHLKRGINSISYGQLEVPLKDLLPDLYYRFSLPVTD